MFIERHTARPKPEGTFTRVPVEGSMEGFHIMGDGSVMTGATHTNESVYLYETEDLLDSQIIESAAYFHALVMSLDSMEAVIAAYRKYS